MPENSLLNARVSAHSERARALRHQGLDPQHCLGAKVNLNTTLSLKKLSCLPRASERDQLLLFLGVVSSRDLFGGVRSQTDLAQTRSFPVLVIY